MIDDDLVTNFIVERKLQQVGITAELNFVENGKDPALFLAEKKETALLFSKKPR